MCSSVRLKKKLVAVVSIFGETKKETFLRE